MGLTECITQNQGWEQRDIAPQGGRSYNGRVFLERRDPQGWVLKALREAGSSIVSELYGVDEKTLCLRPAEGEWCLKEVAAHLRDAEDLMLRQMTAIEDGAGGALPAWDVDVLPLERDYQSGDVEEFLEEFRALRRQTTELLWMLSDSDWHAVGRHPYRGEVALGELAHELAQHDLEHLWQVRRLKHQLGAVPVRRLYDW